MFRLMTFFIYLKILVIWSIHEIEFYSINCTTSPKKSIEFKTCECSGKIISVELNYIRTIEEHYIKFDFYQKKGSQYYQILKFPPVEWCRITQNRTKLYNFQKLIVKAFKKGASAFYHPCPFRGWHRQLNFSAPRDTVQVFPIGKFKYDMLVFDKIDSQLFRIIVEFRVFETRE